MPPPAAYGGDRTTPILQKVKQVRHLKSCRSIGYSLCSMQRLPMKPVFLLSVIACAHMA
jgi:hypothetical protein